MSTVGTKLQECGSALLSPELQHGFGGVQGAVDALNKSIDQHASWVSRLPENYQPVATRVRTAAVHLVRLRTQESLELDHLRMSYSDALEVVKLGSSPDKDILADFVSLLKIALDAEDKVYEAKHALGREQRRGNDDTAPKEALRNAKLEALVHAPQFDKIWKNIYTIASRAYPDLPLRAMAQAKEMKHLHLPFLGNLDARSADLLAPARSLIMYDDLDLISSATKQESRHNVHCGKYAGRDVCLKQFDLGLLDNIALPENMRKFQRELVGVSRLSHDHLIKPHLFFIDLDQNKYLNVYVEYNYYPLGDMHKWMQTANPDALRINIVLQDTLRALEHCKCLAFCVCLCWAVCLAAFLSNMQNSGCFCSKLVKTDAMFRY
jgi:hypothetical protein